MQLSALGALWRLFAESAVLARCRALATQQLFSDRFGPDPKAMVTELDGMGIRVMIR